MAAALNFETTYHPTSRGRAAKRKLQIRFPLLRVEGNRSTCQVPGRPERPRRTETTGKFDNPKRAIAQRCKWPRNAPQQGSRPGAGSLKRTGLGVVPVPVIRKGRV